MAVHLLWTSNETSKKESQANQQQKRVDLSYFFSKKAEPESRVKTKGNDSCDVFLTLSNSGK